MVSYKELGLVNTREMFAKAIKGGYAIPAFNFNNMEQLQAIISGVRRGQFARDPAGVEPAPANTPTRPLLRYMAQGAVEYAKELNGGKGIPITLHLDHGNSFELCKSVHRHGLLVGDDRRFSRLPYEENVALTKKGRGLCAPARRDGGGRAGRAGRRRRRRESFGASRTYTEPDEVIDFVSQHGRRLAGHLDRHVARGQQVQARTVHPQRRGHPRSA